MSELDCVKSVVIHPYPNRRSVLRGAHTLAVMSFEGAMAEIYPVWREFLRPLAKDSGISVNGHLSYPGNSATELEYVYHIPQSSIGIIVEREADRKDNIAKFQQNLLTACQKKNWEIVNLSSLQERVDVASSRIHARGFNGSSSFVLDLKSENTSYGIWINSSRQNMHNSSQEKAQEEAILYGSHGWWTVEEIEQFANDPENSAIFARAMNEMGFRPHKKQPGQWVKK